MLTLSTLTRQYVRVPVSATVTNGYAVLTGDPVQMAFLATTANPQSGDWNTASWDTTATGGYVAECLVGPGGTVQLSPGQYYVWIKVTDAVEQPVVPVGMVEFV